MSAGAVASSALSPHKLQVSNVAFASSFPPPHVVCFLQRLSSIGLVALIPAALVLEPSSLVYPLDLALGILLPVHAHLGMRDVVRDYVPRPELAQYVLWVVTVCTALGLTKLNFNGSGVTAGAKQLWKRTTKSKD